MTTKPFKLTALQSFLSTAIAGSLCLLGLVILFNRDLDSQAQDVQEEAVEAVTPAPDQLMPGRNHNVAAQSYAYDVAEIQAYLTGQQDYTGDKLVFLTIDDGASTEVTPQILDILAAHQVHATFFPIGSYVTEANAWLYQRQLHEGHAIGLHSYWHNLGLLYPFGVPNTDQIVQEAKDSHNSLKRLLGLKFQTRVWRYPGGHMSWFGLEPSDQALKELGLTWIDWNASVGDAEPDYSRPNNLDEMIAFHTSSAEAFGNGPENLRVVLMHDTYGKQLTADALPHIIQYYKDNGYKFGVLY